jgi:hypothetical protein
MTSIALVVGLAILVQAVIGHVLPGVTRPDVFFGVTVDPAFRETDQARRILRRYRAMVWAGTLAALVPVLMFQRFFVVSLIPCRPAGCAGHCPSHGASAGPDRLSRPDPDQSVGP